MTVEAARNDDTDWVSVSNLARERGVSQPAISKRIKALSESGQLTTRQSGRRVLIHRPTFEALAAAAHDPAQDLRNRHQRGASASDDSPRDLVEQSEPLKPAASVETAKEPPKPSAYDDASTREKNAKAQLAEMQLAQKRGELIPVRDIEVAAIEAGTKIAQAVSSLKAKNSALSRVLAKGFKARMYPAPARRMHPIGVTVGHLVGSRPRSYSLSSGLHRGANQRSTRRSPPTYGGRSDLETKESAYESVPIGHSLGL